jgi:hypothetical protein
VADTDIRRDAHALKHRLTPDRQLPAALGFLDDRLAFLGKAGADAGQVVGDDLATPLVIENLDIGDYRIVLALPGGSDFPLNLLGKDLRDGERWALGGLADTPATIKFRKLP